MQNIGPSFVWKPVIRPSVTVLSTLVHYLEYVPVAPPIISLGPVASFVLLIVILTVVNTTVALLAFSTVWNDGF